MLRNIESARKLLNEADVFYDPDDEDPLDAQTLNMNDTFGWALAFGEYVEDIELPEVERLFRRYGHNGLNYWVSEKHNGMMSEFYDVSRGISFVRREEKIVNSSKSSDYVAYKNTRYTLGTPWIWYFYKTWKRKLWFKWLEIKVFFRKKRI